MASLLGLVIISALALVLTATKALAAVAEAQSAGKQRSDLVAAFLEGVKMPGVWVGIAAVAAVMAITARGKKPKQRGVRVELAPVSETEPAEEGVVYRNHRFLSLVEDLDGAATLAALFEQACKEKFPHNRLLGTRTLVKREVQKSADGKSFEKLVLGGYVWLTYAQTFQRVCDFSSGLASLGHGKGERVAMFAETRAEWLIAAQACFRRNAPVVTIYASLGEEALAFSLTETEVTTVVCDVKQLRKLAGLRERLGAVRRVVYMEDGEEEAELKEVVESARGTGWTVLAFSQVEARGQQSPAPADLPSHSDTAVIMYTSGSTGMPKGVVMSHRNLAATVGGITQLVPGLGPEDTYIAYLPLAHVLELAAEVVMVGSGAGIGYGSPLTLTDTSNKIQKGSKGDTSELRPTLMTAVPAILDRVRDGVRRQLETKGGLVKALFDLAYGRRLAAVEGKWWGAWGLEKALWDALVFGKVRAVLGGRLRGLLSGGAPLAGDTQRFINVCLGTPIGQGYGLTETCAGATFSEWDDSSVGRVGPPVPHCYVKLVSWEEGGYRVTDEPMPRGEVVIGGPSVTLGYFKNEAKTEEVYKTDARGLRWFYTGDIGQFHPDGCLEIVDRKKDIVKLQHGEYVSLSKVEAGLAGSKFVDNIMVHADPFHSFVVALVVAAEGALEDWARKAGVEFEGIQDLCSKKEAVQEVLRSLAQVGKQSKLERFEIPTKIKLLPEPWTPESGLVTAALKLKREALKKAFGSELKALYA